MKQILAEIKDGIVRPAVHRRPGRRRAGVQGAPRAKGEQHPIEEHRPRAAQADGLGEVPRRRLHRGAPPRDVPRRSRGGQGHPATRTGTPRASCASHRWRTSANSAAYLLTTPRPGPATARRRLRAGHDHRRARGVGRAREVVAVELNEEAASLTRLGAPGVDVPGRRRPRTAVRRRRVRRRARPPGAAARRRPGRGAR